jgi:hypothetical protein
VGTLEPLLGHLGVDRTSCIVEHNPFAGAWNTTVEVFVAVDSCLEDTHYWEETKSVDIEGAELLDRQHEGWWQVQAQLPKDPQ